MTMIMTRHSTPLIRFNITNLARMNGPMVLTATFLLWKSQKGTALKFLYFLRFVNYKKHPDPNCLTLILDRWIAQRASMSLLIFLFMFNQSNCATCTWVLIKIKQKRFYLVSNLWPPRHVFFCLFSVQPAIVTWHRDRKLLLLWAFLNASPMVRTPDLLLTSTSLFFLPKPHPIIDWHVAMAKNKHKPIQKRMKHMSIASRSNNNVFLHYSSSFPW